LPSFVRFHVMVWRNLFILSTSDNRLSMSIMHELPTLTLLAKIPYFLGWQALILFQIFRFEFKTELWADPSSVIVLLDSTKSSSIVGLWQLGFGLPRDKIYIITPSGLPEFLNIAIL
jgi:hypothetical protein